MINKKVTSLFIFIIAISFIIYVLATTNFAQVGAEEGMIAPDFSLPLWETGEEKQLSSFRGNIVVLNLWASWCPPCRSEMPDLVKLAKDYQNQGVIIIGVNLALQERSMEAVEEFMEEYEVDFPTFIDQPNENRRGIVSTAYNINSIPNTYVLDQKGRILKIFEGAITYEMLESYIEEIR